MSFIILSLSNVNIVINLPYPCDAKTFTISISHVSPFIAFGTNIVNPSILAIPSPSKPLSIHKNEYLFHSDMELTHNLYFL